MELFQVEIKGFKKFQERAVLKTRGKLVSLIGPNEAGKSSILQALTHFNSNDAIADNELSRGCPDSELELKATYLLSEEDKAHAHIGEAVWFHVHKRHDGRLNYSIDPPPAHRDYSGRGRLLQSLGRLGVAARRSISDVDAILLGDTDALLKRLFADDVDLSDKEKDLFSSLLERWVECAEGGPPPVKKLTELFLEVQSIEFAQSKKDIAINILADRRPKFLLFGPEERNLKSYYEWQKIIDEEPIALMNLAAIAEIDVADLAHAALVENNASVVDTIIDKGNRKLVDNFNASWKQSKVSVVLSAKESGLHIQVHNNDLERTDFAQRSDGLRQFVALSSFAFSGKASDFILLIDEIEQHLHYDAQADLVQMMAGQKIASKVIYTTHSLGCLPEDLGNGLRLVVPESENSDWSKIVNKFWASEGNQGAAFSPILVGIGASAMAFFPTRNAILVEGPSDSILLPTMFREVLSLSITGAQFIHGVAEGGNINFPILNSSGLNVRYLLDGDSSGRMLRDKILEKGVNAEYVFLLPSSNGDVELEDFIDTEILCEAANCISKRHHDVTLFPLDKKLPKTLPKRGKWDAIVLRCHELGVGKLDKTAVAYEILDILDSRPGQRIIDKLRVKSFTNMAEKIVGTIS